MAGTIGAVRIEGLAQTQNALRRVNRDAAKRMREELAVVAEPVKRDAESFAIGAFPPRDTGSGGIGPEWYKMRVGITSRIVYVAAATRSRDPLLKRSNLVGLMLDRAMIPALEKNEETIFGGVEGMFDRLASENGF